MPIITGHADELQRGAGTRAMRLWLVACYAAALFALAWPIVHVSNPMLADYPNHLARLFVAGSVPDNAALAQSYLVRHDFYPYLSMDLMVRALWPLLGLELAGKVFLVIALLMPLAGMAALARVLHGRIGLWPLAGTLFIYNLLLAWGFTTYLFGLGLAMGAFAGWIATERWRWLPRIALFAAVSTVLFCAHPFSFAVYGLLFGSWEIGRTRDWTLPALRETARRLAFAAPQALPPVVIALSLPHADIGNTATVFGTPTSRLLGLFSPFIFAVDIGEAVCILLLLAALVTALRTGMVTFDRRLAWPVGVIGFLSLVMPQTLSGVYLVHMRLPLLFILLLILACRPQPQAPRIAALSVTAIMSVLVLRTSVAADHLAEIDRDVAELRAIGASIEPGARLLPTMSHEQNGAVPAYHYWHASAFLTIDRAAYYPLLFSFFCIDVVPELKASSAPATSPVKFEILLTPAGEPERVKLPPGQLRYWQDWRRVFDYVVDYDGGMPAAQLPPELSLVRRGSVFSLYRIAK